MNTEKRLVNCVKLKRSATGLDSPPYPGKLGEKIYHHVSQEAWQQWLDYLTVLINEGRLAVDQPEVKEMLKNKMVQFLNLEHIN